MRGEKNWQGSDARTGKIAMPGICSHLRRTVSPGSCARSFTRRIRAMVSPAAAEMNTAYIDAKLAIDGASAGPLAGLTFAVKDMYDIAGQRTGFGNPSWKETHPTATATAPVVQQLLDAGASLRGKTHCDELTYSLNGENTHYGTPPNPAAPGHIPGGDVDFALGSDTGGSIRIPASYCGLFGLRPTHGRVSLAGARPLAPSFDCAGHFARDANVLKAVGDVLLGSSHQAPSKLNRWLVASDAFALAQPPTRQALRSILSSRLEPLFQKPAEVNVAEGLKSQSLGLSAWFDVFRICQGWEIWREHGEWIRSHNPSFGPGVAERFKMVSELTEQAWQENARKREQIRAHVTQLLQDDGALLMPTAPGPAPLLATPAQQLDDWRKRMISLTSLAGLCGLPEVSLPVAKVDGLPVGMSIVGPAGSDEDLLELAGQVALLLESKP